MNKTNKSLGDTYHHGDLKNELIYKGIYLLAKEGYEGLTLRKLAAFCNVSHAAPYKHFKSKEDLIFAITEKIADEFAGSLEYSFNADGDPKKRLHEIVMQYIKFMTQNPDYFRLVFMVRHPIEWNEENIRQNRTLSLFMQAAKLCFDPESRSKLFLQDFLELWCLINGFTLMLVNRTIKADEKFLETAQMMIVDLIDSKEW